MGPFAEEENVKIDSEFFRALVKVVFVEGIIRIDFMYF